MRNVLTDEGVRGQSVYHQGARGGISPSAYIYESDSYPRNHIAMAPSELSSHVSRAYGSRPSSR